MSTTRLITGRIDLLPVIAIILILLSIPSTLPAEFLGVQYGPRAFANAPIGTQALDLKADYMDMAIDVSGRFLSSIDNTSKAVYISYTRYFELFGKTASLLGALPFVDIESKVKTSCCGSFEALSTSGLTDPFIQFNVGLVGQQAMELKEFYSTEPGFAMSLHTGMRLPLGKYDSDSPLNVGSNRYEFRAGLPMSYTWGTPTRQTSFEFSPIVYFFQPNSDPFGALRVTQGPALQIEAHLVHDFLPTLWGSLNALRVWGGETKTDGVKGNNPLDYTSVGFSIGGRLSRHMGYSMSYGQRFNSKNDQDNGSLIRAGLTYTF